MSNPQKNDQTATPVLPQADQHYIAIVTGASGLAMLTQLLQEVQAFSANTTLLVCLPHELILSAARALHNQYTGLPVQLAGPDMDLEAGHTYLLDPVIPLELVSNRWRYASPPAVQVQVIDHLVDQLQSLQHSCCQLLLLPGAGIGNVAAIKTLQEHGVAVTILETTAAEDLPFLSAAFNAGLGDTICTYPELSAKLGLGTAWAQPSVPVGKHQQLEHVIAQANRSMHLILDNTEESFILIDTDLRIITYNKIARQQLTRIAGVELLPGDLILNAAADGRGEFLKELYGRLLAGEQLSYIYEVPELDGNRQLFELKYRPIFNKQGAVSEIMLNARDVTREKRLEEELRQSESQFRGAFEFSAIGMALVSLEGRWMEVNDSICQILGYTREEFFQFTFQEITHPEDLVKDLALLEQLVAGKISTYQMEKRYFHKNGALVWGFLSVSGVRSEAGELLYFISEVQDISSRKSMEAKLFASEERYRQIVETAQEGIWITDENMRLIFVNKKVQEMLEYSESELLGKKAYALMSEEWQRLFSTENNNQITGKAISRDIKFISRSGSAIWASTTISTLFGDEGNKLGSLYMITDITNRKMAEEALIRTSGRLRLATRAASIGIWDWKLTDNSIEWDDQMCRLYGLDPGFFKGTLDAWMEQIYPDDLENVRQQLQYAAEGSHDPDLEYRILWPNQSIRHIKALAIVQRDINGKPIRVIGTNWDITNQKEDEKQKAFLASIVQSAHEAIIGHSLDGRISSWNNGAEQLFGFSEAEMLGTRGLAIVPAAHRQTEQEMLAKIAGGTHFSEVMLERLRKDGSKILIAATISPIRDAMGAVVGLSTIAWDITAKQKAEEAIRISNERYDLVAQASNDNIWDWDLVNNQVTRPGKQLETQLGYAGQEAASVDAFWASHVHPEDWPRLTSNRNKLLADTTKNYWEDEYRFRRPDGTYAWVYDRGYIIRNDDGTPIRIIGASRDISKEKHQVNEIIRIQQNLHSLINTTTDLIWSVDVDLKIIAANEAFINSTYPIAGYRLQEGDEVLIAGLPEETKTKWRQLYQRALAGNHFSIDEHVSHSDSEEQTYDIITFSPIVSATGTISGVACFSKDVTALHLSGLQLQQVNVQLEQHSKELAASNAELERFAYVASHDLQEPLRMITSFLQLLEKKYGSLLDENAKKYIHFAVDGANRMKNLILDLLEYSRIGNPADATTVTDLNLVLEEVAQNLRPEINRIHATLQIDKLPVLPHANSSQMIQLFQNLIGNALKYNVSKEPLVQVRVVESEREWKFEVADNGIGIDPRYFEKVFIIFQRLHNKTEYSGSGIGLSICKKIVERHGGRIWVESAPGKGSQFYFTILKSIPDQYERTTK